MLILQPELHICHLIPIKWSTDELTGHHLHQHCVVSALRNEASQIPRKPELGWPFWQENHGQVSVGENVHMGSDQKESLLGSPPCSSSAACPRRLLPPSPAPPRAFRWLLAKDRRNPACFFNIFYGILFYCILFCLFLFN